jgi:hypothetical protein
VQLQEQEQSQEYAVVVYGKPTKESLDKITEAADKAFDIFSENPEKFQELVKNPMLASTSEEKIGIMGMREIILLIDKSGSMSGQDSNPQLTTPENTNQPRWTLWDSARVATESILEISLAIDKDHKIDVATFPSLSEKGINRGDYKLVEMSSIADIQHIFSRNLPSGSTPLADVLISVRKQKLEHLINEGISSTIIIMTDGVPDNEQNVKDFFVNLIRDFKLNEEGRQYLVAFSFVQIGDDLSATRFLTDMDDNMAQYYKSKGVEHVDIIDTKKDNFLFGTDEYASSNWKGPFALLHDAIYD